MTPTSVINWIGQQKYVSGILPVRHIGRWFNFAWVRVK